jgi:hypothetical protein
MIVRGKMSGAPSSAERIGEELAAVLLKGGADRILETIRSTEQFESAEA